MLIINLMTKDNWVLSELRGILVMTLMQFLFASMNEALLGETA